MTNHLRYLNCLMVRTLDLGSGDGSDRCDIGLYPKLRTVRADPDYYQRS